jgi:hypothetical protein
MRAGDESALLRRDQGPERRLVRDIVDARRNMTSFFLLLLPVVIASNAVPALGPVVLALLLLMVFDAVLIGRRVRRVVGERFPKTNQSTLRLTLYGVNRTILPRRWRLPKPQVRLGDTV